MRGVALRTGAAFVLVSTGFVLESVGAAALVVESVSAVDVAVCACGAVAIADPDAIGALLVTTRKSVTVTGVATPGTSVAVTVTTCIDPAMVIVFSIVIVVPTLTVKVLPPMPGSDSSDIEGNTKGLFEAEDRGASVKIAGSKMEGEASTRRRPIAIDSTARWRLKAVTMAGAPTSKPRICNLAISKYRQRQCGSKMSD